MIVFTFSTLSLGGQFANFKSHKSSICRRLFFTRKKTNNLISFVKENTNYLKRGRRRTLTMLGLQGSV